MREILFRGKRAGNGEWVYGYYIKATHHWHKRGIHKDWIATGATQNGGWCNVYDKHAVIPATIGQYTGLTDKNGTKIFGGDIVKLFLIYDTEVGVIGWSDIDFRFKITLSDGVAYGFDVTDKFEVIGNIHDNPELLSGAE